MSEPARIAGVYIEPTKAFADIVARPGRWWVPMLLVIIASLVFVSAYSQRVGWEKMIRHNFETSSRTQNMPAEQKEQAIQNAVKFTGISVYVVSVVATPIMIFVVGGVLMLVMNSLLGAQVNFAQSRAIAAYSFLVGLVTALLSLGVMFLKSPEDFDIQNPLAFNAGAFLNPDSAAKWLVTLASSFDLFTFWTMALLATGFAAVSRKLKWSKVFMAVVIPWVLWVMMKTGWAALFS